MQDSSSPQMSTHLVRLYLQFAESLHAVLAVADSVAKLSPTRGLSVLDDLLAEAEAAGSTDAKDFRSLIAYGSEVTARAELVHWDHAKYPFSDSGKSVEQRLADALVALPDASAAAIAVERMKLSRGHGLALGGLLSIEVSLLEDLARGLASALHEGQPSRLRSTQISFEDAERAGSIDAIRNLAIGRRVDSVMSSAESWMKWFSAKGQLGTPVVDLAADSSRFTEVLHRRHAVIHAGGRVTPRYLRATGSGLDEGDLLDVDLEYVRAASSELAAVGIGLLTQVAQLLDRSSSIGFALRSEAITQDLPALGLWPAMVRLGSSSDLAVPAVDHEAGVILRIHALWAQQELGRDIRSELHGLPCGSTSRSSLLRALLLDRDEAEAALLDALADSVISPNELRSTPLIRRNVERLGLADIGSRPPP